GIGDLIGIAPPPAPRWILSQSDGHQPKRSGRQPQQYGAISHPAALQGLIEVAADELPETGTEADDGPVPLLLDLPISPLQLGYFLAVRPPVVTNLLRKISEPIIEAVGAEPAVIAP